MARKGSHCLFFFCDEINQKNTSSLVLFCSIMNEIRIQLQKVTTLSDIKKTIEYQYSIVHLYTS